MQFRLKFLVFGRIISKFISSKEKFNLKLNLMKPITKVADIYLPKFNNAEYTQFLSGVDGLIQKATPEQLGLAPDLVEAFRQNIERLTDISRQSRTSDESAELVVADRKREDRKSVV